LNAIFIAMGVNGSVTTAGRSFSGATCRDTAAGNQPGLDVPVLFFVFNRLPEVERVFEAIRQARPSRLYLAGDGPRPERRGEVLKCEAVRRHVTGKIDWPCEVRTFFKDSNAGPRIAIGEAITWFFENEEMGDRARGGLPARPGILPILRGTPREVSGR
jgi:hypothetical protein